MSEGVNTTLLTLKALLVLCESISVSRVSFPVESYLIGSLVSSALLDPQVSSTTIAAASASVNIQSSATGAGNVNCGAVL